MFRDFFFSFLDFAILEGILEPVPHRHQGMTGYILSAFYLYVPGLLKATEL